MPIFRLKISDHFEVETTIECKNAHEAVNAAFNALSQFACKKFPPPENVTIAVMLENRVNIATLGLAFTIAYAPGFTA